MGVNEFTDRTGQVRNLRFAVNDAVELAHLFSLELRLIPPANVTLALAGDTSGDDAAGRLRALKEAGATVTPARKSPIFGALAAARDRGTGDGDLLVIACSSHGFTGDGEAYLMPTEGRLAFLDDTAVRLRTVESPPPAAARRATGCC